MTQAINAVAIFFFLLLLLACGNSERKDVVERSNRLANASSPYLREHSDNPVYWYEWGAEALEKSKKENKPLLISIGYASCHWCHVMEAESFMDTAVARFMNDNFISIKVDREERPDVDQIYLNAAQLISGNAGWPLNAFALPDGRPFYAATYFPKNQWLNLLKQITSAYKEDQSNVLKQAEAVTKGIKSSESIVSVKEDQGNYNKETYQGILKEWQPQFDNRTGGLSGSPKFPMPVVWEYLLQNHYLTGNKKSLEIVMTTLDNMANGGIYDQLGGGFARYSTDADWKVPHFEKMLYDNGQLISLYSHAYRLTKNSRYLEVIHETLEFIKREMTSPEGGFYSSLNADSEGEEGKFYVWRKRELEDILDKKTAQIFFDHYNIVDSGNWESQKNILYRTGVPPNDTRDAIIKNAKKQALTERGKRVRPSLDDKIITSWNALMLTGYVDAYFATGNVQYLEVALRNGQFIADKMLQGDGKLWRTYMDGTTSIEAFLDDYALLTKAYVRLYEATFDMHWLELARTTLEYTIRHFHDEASGLFFYTSDESEFLIARKMELADNVIPSSNSVMAEVLYRLGTYYDKQDFIIISRAMLNQVADSMFTNGPYYANWASLMGLITYEPYEVAIMGEQATEMTRLMQRSYLPTVMFMGGVEEKLPLLENKYVKGETIIYVCRNKVCKLPVREVEKALQQLK